MILLAGGHVLIHTNLMLEGGGRSSLGSSGGEVSINKGSSSWCLLSVLSGSTVDVGNFLFVVNVVFVGERVGVEGREAARAITTTSQTFVRSSSISSSVENKSTPFGAFILSKEVVK
ncbi:hypothetical protein HG530_009917 [Fusarium avenaceum]|nr:hypothetical protein HG530_009917 [Fusarium avenaceum]